MKILMVSMFSPHFFNWTEQLKDSGHEIYWFDVNASGEYVKQIDFVHQFTSWKYRWDFPGRYWLKGYPGISKGISFFNEKNLVRKFEDVIIEINPHVVHSFAFYLSVAPIYTVMQKFPYIKWIYSAWGSDLYYRQTIIENRNDLKKILPNIDYLITDCKRDCEIAEKLGFNGEFLGVFPGRGGYDLISLEKFIAPFKERKQIIIKGYQDHLGRSIPILRSLLMLKEDLRSYKIFVFGCPPEVMRFLDQEKFTSYFHIKYFGQIPHSEVMQEMGRSCIYIGNSLSDGIPNTLLEAIVMKTFPIQSDPGGATSEIITEGKNGLLIKDSEHKEYIASQIRKAIKNPDFLQKAVNYNTKNLKPRLDKNFVQSKVINQYNLIQNNL